MGFWSSCCGLPMLAEMTLSKGRASSPGGVGGACWESFARYCSERVASSPRTAYLASLTCGLMLSMLRLRKGVVVDMVRAVVELRDECL